MAVCLLLWVDASAQSGEEQGVKMTVLLYSGRPNPSVMLDEGAVARLEEMLASATAQPQFDRDTVVPSILGYNGILVENLSGQGTLPRRLVAYKGDLEAQNGETRFLSDESGALEGFLVDTALAADVLDADAAQMLRDEVPEAPAEPQEPTEPEESTEPEGA